MVSWSERISHTGTGTRSRLLREAAVRKMLLTVPVEEAPANSVPAAAVIRGAQALFGIIGRKGRAGGLVRQV